MRDPKDKQKRGGQTDKKEQRDDKRENMGQGLKKTEGLSELYQSCWVTTMRTGDRFSLLP